MFFQFEHWGPKIWGEPQPLIAHNLPRLLINGPVDFSGHRELTNEIIDRLPYCQVTVTEVSY